MGRLLNRQPAAAGQSTTSTSASRARARLELAGIRAPQPARPQRTGIELDWAALDRLGRQLAAQPRTAWWRRGDLSLLLQHIAQGRWSQARPLAKRLATKADDESLSLEILHWQLWLQARDGELAPALEELRQWQAVLAMISPALYSARQADLYRAARQIPQALACQEQARLLAGDALTTLETALLEARYGILSKAQRLSLEIDGALLPESRAGYLPWVNGLVALRQGREAQALRQLQQALRSLLPRAAEPAAWPALAQLGADLALVLFRQQHSREAIQLLRCVWPVLAVHGDRVQLKVLRRSARKYKSEANS